MCPGSYLNLFFTCFSLFFQGGCTSLNLGEVQSHGVFFPWEFSVSISYLFPCGNVLNGFGIFEIKFVEMF